MWYAGDSPVRTYHPPGKVLEYQVVDLACGPNLPGSFARYHPDSYSWRTRQCSLVEGLESYLETWPNWGMMRGGDCSPLAMLEHDTSVKGCGSLPTPCRYGNGGTRATKKLQSLGVSRHKINPSQQEWLMLWPEGWTELTPLEMDRFHKWLLSHGESSQEITND